jgi:DNA-binding GntR family transcriptional regulator
LNESSIADQLDVSRAPVREALSVLEKEGLIVKVPRRGYFVREFTMKDIEEIYGLRLLLETEALRRIVGRPDEGAISHLEQVVDKLCEAAYSDDREAIVKWDMAFHRLMCELADHRRLLSAWESLGLQSELLIGVTIRTYDHGAPHKWHQTLVEAIRERDVERAVRALTRHLLIGEKLARQALVLAQTEEREDSV